MLKREWIYQYQGAVNYRDYYHQRKSLFEEFLNLWIDGSKDKRDKMDVLGQLCLVLELVLKFHTCTTSLCVQNYLSYHLLYHGFNVIIPGSST